jgi:hypothetical protein
MTTEEEYAIRSQLKWKRDGSDWVLLRSLDYLGLRYVGLCPGMTYVPWGPGIA